MKYFGASGADYHSRRHKNYDGAERHIIKNRGLKFQKYIKKTSSVLEYGSGIGWNLKGIEARERVAFDTAETLSENYSDTDINFVSSDEGLHGRTFDVIICHHVLEHVENPSIIIQQLKKYAHRETLLILCVPSEVQARFNRGILKNDKDHHLYTWNLNTFRNFLIYSKLNIREIEVRHFGYELFCANLSRRLPFFIYRILVFVAQNIRPEAEVFCLASME
jgi:SAM-dependent methyltransferase